MDEEFRLKVAREGLAAYREYIGGDRIERISPSALADLAASAEWLIEMLDQADVTVGEC